MPALCKQMTKVEQLSSISPACHQVARHAFARFHLTWWQGQAGDSATQLALGSQCQVLSHAFRALPSRANIIGWFLSQKAFYTHDNEILVVDRTGPSRPGPAECQEEAKHGCLSNFLGLPLPTLCLAFLNRVSAIFSKLSQCTAAILSYAAAFLFAPVGSSGLLAGVPSGPMHRCIDCAAVIIAQKGTTHSTC